MRLEDNIIRAMGTWRFTLVNLSMVVGWVAYNVLGDTHPDPYPFILLNLLISLYTMTQSSIIMISQSRIQEADRKLAEGTAENTKVLLDRIGRLDRKLTRKLDIIEEGLEDE